jgi:L-alanine-DL-glutamate epimerase-like enolase superfamily enzyme
VYREREYAVVRLRLAGGVAGEAFGYTRGLPVAETLQRLGPLVRGLDATRPDAAVAELAATHANAGVGLVRALSLLEIALRDAQARLAGQPLWRLLGGARDRVPVLAVGGYFLEARGVDDVADELLRLADAGFRELKVHTTDPAVAGRLATAVAGRAALAVDVHMAWRTLPDAVAACRRLDDLGLAFIEDPFPPELHRLTAELACQVRTPLAAGEEASGPAQLVDLLDGVGVLRVDATTSGGFGGVLGAAAVAAARGRRVMTHAFPDLHAHLAGAAAVGTVEMIPDDAGANPIGQLLARRQRVDAGELVLSDEPGHGAPLSWEAVARHARSLVTVESDS